jgi:hypothetical protein
MCQVILTETDAGRVDEHNVIYETVDAINQRLYIDSETKTPIDMLPEVEVAITPVQNLFSRIEGTDFRFVETVGFDDPSTDPANRAWFAENTKWADVLLFITDKEKCMNTMTEHTLLRETIKDLSNVNTFLGKAIPLIVVINKIEEPDDAEVQEMVNQCKKIVRRILDEVSE